MTLKEILIKELQSKKYLTVDDIERIARENGYRASNSLRRFRHDEKKHNEILDLLPIEIMRNSKGFVLGYRLREDDRPLSKNAINAPKNDLNLKKVVSQVQDTLFALEPITEENKIFID